MLIGYLILKIVHLLAVVIFLGNIITGIFWMRSAVLSQDVAVIRHTIQGIIKADRIFTIPAVIVLALAGLGAALHGGLSLIGNGWILWSIVLLLISGYAFSAKLAPIQRKILKLTQENEFSHDHFTELLSQWNLWGLVATITPLVAFILMVLKLPK